MAIIAVTETWEQRGGKMRDDYSRDAVRTFRVHCDSAAHVAQEIYLAAGIPRVGDPYSAGLDNSQVDHKSLCREVSADHDQDDPFNWLVTCTYGTRESETGKGGGDQAGGPNQGGPGGPGGSSNTPGHPNTETPPQRPEQRPAEVEWTFETYQRAKEYAYSPVDEDGADTTGEPMRIQNAAGDDFVPPPEVDVDTLVLKVTRNEVVFDRHNALRMHGKVNDFEFQGFGPGKVRCLVGPVVLQYEALYGFYYKVTYTFKMRDEGWWLTLLNQGENAYLPKPSAPGTYEKTAALRDPRTGHKTGKLVLLDLDGKLLAEGEPPTFVRYRVYKKEDFNDLDLGVIP